MSGIRGVDTTPELFLRKGLHALGFRFRLHARDIPGKPDIVFRKYHALISVHGCFWHGHGCRYFKWPRSNADFWRNKIASNTERDRRNFLAQNNLGWRVLIVWECAVRRAQREKDFDLAGVAAQWLVSNAGSGVLDDKGVRFT